MWMAPNDKGGYIGLRLQIMHYVNTFSLIKAAIFSWKVSSILVTSLALNLENDACLFL